MAHDDARGDAAPASASLTRESPFPRRFAAWLAERFPPLGHGLLIAAYFSSNQFLAEALTHPGEPVRYTARSILGALALLGFFFHLRVFDEHKDYADDCRNHPERVLQSGLITLRHLKIAAAIAIAVEFACAGLAGPAALVGLALPFAFSLLMLREFFVPGWLRRHFLIYATSHMFVMPLLSLAVYSFATGRMPWTAPRWFLLWSFVGFFVSFNWEISRKIRAPEDERDGVDSYSKVFGTRGAVFVVLAVRAVDTGLVAIVGHALGFGTAFYVLLAALYAVCLVSAGRFLAAPSKKTAKLLEVWAGLYIILFDLILAIELVRKLGLRFGAA